MDCNLLIETYELKLENLGVERDKAKFIIQKLWEKSTERAKPNIVTMERLTRRFEAFILTDIKPDEALNKVIDLYNHNYI